MKKTSATHTKFTSLLILATLLVVPIASPTVVDAQRAGTTAAKPTASITVNGAQNATVEAGAKAPVVRWVSKNGTAHKTTLKVNNASLCGVKNGQVWGSGKNAQGTANALAPTAARAGCVLTFVYEVTNRLGQKASDTAIVRYVAAKPAPTKPKPTIINPNTGGSGTGTSTTPSNQPAISITTQTKDVILSGNNISYTFAGTNLNVPSNVRVELYSPVNTNTGNPVVYGNIGESTFTRSSEYGSILAPTTPGQYRLTVCDDNTPNPTAPFKPICAHSEYFGVRNNSATSSDITVTSISESATVDLAEYAGDIERGIYEIEVDVQAGNNDVFIPDFRDIPGFTYSITDTGIPFTGSTTAYIAESNAPYLGGVGVAGRYRVAQNTSANFTLRVELDPIGSSSGRQFGIRLLQLHYGNSTSTVDKAYMFPNSPEFETNKVTIASALPTGTIERTVAQGETGEQVTLVQSALKKAGLFNEEITGYFGNITRAAVKAFQREHALENIGAVGPRTATLLNEWLK